MPFVRQKRPSTSSEASLERLMTEDEVAAHLGKSKAWLQRCRWLGEGPKFIKIGRTVRYRPADIRTYENEQVFASTAEYANSAE